jgi:hypothetical protein
VSRIALTDPVPFPFWVRDLDDLSALDDAFNISLLPLAKSLRLCEDTDTLATLLAKGELMPKSKDSVRSWALWLFFGSVALIYKVKEPAAESDDAEQLIDARMASTWCAHCQGFLMGMRESSLEAIRRGAAGRRLIGASTREKIRREALKLTPPGLSKEKAAFQIADSVQLSSGTVRRLLSELFPGSSWHHR